MPDKITFSPLSHEHRDLLVDWTAQPHVKQWWSEADGDVDSFFEGSDEHWPFIGFVDGQAVTYIQSWRPTQNPNYAWQHGMAPSTRGIDLFIGPPALLRKGHGVRIVKTFSAILFCDGATRIVTDPDLQNTNAISTFIKAGFKPYDKAKDFLLMELLPE